MDHKTYPLTLFYDAGCPVCSLEMDHLRERNRDGRLVFVDISAPGFDPAPYGVTWAAMDAQIHGLTAGGSMMRGVQVLRLAYQAAGLGWVLRPVGWTPLRPLAEAGYRVFARHRRTLSRFAAPLIDGIRAARANRMAERMRDCRSGACEVDARHSGRSS
jgi:predicted DCC family thiol-disulfide oxidoreductase YuxK